MDVISSVANPRIKQLIRFKESRVRRRENRFLIDGVREIVRAWESGFRFVEVYLPTSLQILTTIPRSEPLPTKSAEIWNGSPRHLEELRSFLTTLKQKRTPVFWVQENLFPKICFGDRNEGMIAVVEGRAETFDDWFRKLPENPLIGVLENIEKPGNIGAVYRSADGAGIDGMILVSDRPVDLFNPNAIRASLGTLFRIPTVETTSREAIERLNGANIQIAAAICDSAVSYSTVDFRRPTAIVLGSEADGLTDVWSNLSTFESESNRIEARRNGTKIQAVKLPMLGIADSLNISTAAAVLFYEARRQRDAG